MPDNKRRLESHFCWNFLNYLGSIDGKLLAVVDAKYCFRVVDVGSYGRTSDRRTLANSTFGQALIDGTFQFPEDALLPGDEHLGTHVFVADEAFSLHKNLMRHFPGVSHPPRNTVFNYWLSRARMIVENAFGILSSQWHMYCQGIGMSLKNVDVYV